MSAPPRRSAEDYLTTLDIEWNRRLKMVSLATEVAVDADEVEQALRLIGGRYRRLHDSAESDARRLLHRWPAVLVMSMVHAATDYYERGNFWTPFFETAGLTNNGENQRAWGSAFLEDLRRLGLPTFEDVPESGTKFVGRVLLHAGMPTYCLADFFQLLADHRRAERDMTGASFVARAATDAQRGRLAADKPVQRFLQYGGAYAVDVSDRSLDLIDDLLAGGDGARALLPPRFVRVATELASDRVFDDLRRQRRGALAQEERAASPRLVLDPYGRGAIVRLPAATDTTDGVATWQVTVDGQRDVLKSRVMWPGSSEPAPSTDFLVSRPARAALVRSGLRDDGPLMVVPLIDDADPLVFFDVEGERLPSSVPLPNKETWLLYPADISNPDPLVFGGKHRAVAEGRMPVGWSGWRAELIDLADVKSVALGASGKEHVVRGTYSAQVLTGEAVEGLKTPYGAAVFSQPPRIELPTANDDGIPWEVSIADGRGKVLLRELVETTAGAAELWSRIPRPLLGTYQIQVRGPWGRGCSRRVVVAEGVSITCKPAWRRFGRGGLVPVEVEVRVSSGITADNMSMSFGPTRRTAPLVLSRTEHSDTFVLTPPHMTVSYETASSAGRASVQPLALETEALLEDAGSLLVHLGDGADPSLHVLNGGTSIQVLPPAARVARGVYRFDLSRIVDTLRDRSAAVLALDPAGEVALANLRPRKLAARADVVGGIVVLEGARDISGLTAAVYLLRAPWRGPLALPVVDGCVTLPGEYADAGAMLVSLYIDDPWVPTEPPRWPSAADTMLIDRPGNLRSPDADESALSALLAGHAQLPDGYASLERVWVVLDLIDALQLGTHAAEVRRACRELLQRQPAAAVAAYVRAALDPITGLAAFAGSGVLQRVRRVPAASSALWSESPLSAVLSISRGPVPHPGPRRLMSGKTVDDAIDFCGEAAAELLDGRPDPFRNSGRLDAAADQYARLSSAHRAAFQTAVAFVPKAFLDTDTRSAAAMRLIERRLDGRSKSVVASSGRLLKDAKALLQRVEDKRYFWAVQAREHPTASGGWQALSALSIAFALLARLQAREQVNAMSWLDFYGDQWAALARIAPELTTIDLVLAEMLCLGSARPATQGDSQ